MQVGQTRVPRWVGWAACLLVAGFALFKLWGVMQPMVRPVLTPIFFAFLIAYLLDPVVDRFEARGLPRVVGILIVLVLTLGAIALFLVLLLPAVIGEVVTFVHELPHRLDALRLAVEPWLVAHGVALPHTLDDLRHLLSSGSEGDAPISPGQIAERAGAFASAAGQWVLGGTAGVVNVITTLIVVPVLAFYLLHDFDRITSGIRDLVPWRYRPFVVDVAKEVDQVLGQFVRGQLLVMLSLAILYSTAYTVVGVRLAIPIGLIAGLLSFIPYVGGATALVLALAMTLLNWTGWGQVIGVLAAYAVIQGLEGFVITPRIVGNKVGLHAVWVLVALMAFGELFGFLGVLLAVPTAAVCKIFVVRALAWYRKTDLFREGGPQHAPEEEGPLEKILHEEGLPDDPATAEAKAHPTPPPNVIEASPTAVDAPQPEVATSIEGALVSVVESIPPQAEDRDE